VAAVLARVLVAQELEPVLVRERERVEQELVLVLVVREPAAAVMAWEIPIPVHILVRSRFTRTGWARKRFTRGRQKGNHHSDLGVGLRVDFPRLVHVRDRRVCAVA
jgi:hypothetical protein